MVCLSIDFVFEYFVPNMPLTLNCCYLQKKPFSGALKKIGKMFVNIVAGSLNLKCFYKPETITYMFSLESFTIFQFFKKHL